MGVCCENCFSNKHIQRVIVEYDEKGDCNYCFSKQVHIVSTECIGGFIRSKLGEYYENVDDSGMYYDSEEKLYTHGEEVFEVLNDTECIFSEKLYKVNKEHKLFCDLMSDSGLGYEGKKDGEIDWLDEGNALIVLKDEIFGIDENRFSMSWQRFKYQCKHYARYFDMGAENTRESLLRVLAELLNKEEVTIYMENGCRLYRARVIDVNFDFNIDPVKMLKEVGPPLKGGGKNNRMSPAGISYMYLSNAPEVCFAEISPIVNDSVLIAEFQIAKRLKILDLTSIPNFKIRSIFDDEYDPDIRWARSFMGYFTSEISSPISEDDAILKYVPTQLLAEFIRKLGFDGVKYASSLKQSGFNYTLYCGPQIEKTYGSQEEYYNHLIEFTHWMKLHKVSFHRVLNTFELISSREFNEKDFIIKEC